MSARELAHGRRRAARTTGISSLTTGLLALALFACGAPNERDWDRAAAAIRAGDFAAAESAAGDAARESPAYAPLVDFVRGSAAFSRSERAEAEADRPGAEPTWIDRAIADAEDALVAWRKAATSRDDWPEARRNVERAILRIERLRKKKAGTPPPGSPSTTKPGGDKPSPRQPDLPPPPPPPPSPTGAPGREDPSVEVTTSELPAGDVLRLLDVLAKKEREKQALRRSEREARRAGGDVEKDW